MARHSQVLLVLIIVAIIGGGALSIPRFNTAVEEGRTALADPVSLNIDGRELAYREAGDGAPVLIIHGAGGGYDQGLLLGNAFVGEDFRILAPSRFGYPGSPVPQNSGPIAQADMFAAMLDRIGITHAAVVAFSDGGPAALQFALRHPERMTALVLVSARTMSLPEQAGGAEAILELAAGSDYGFWALTELLRPFATKVFGPGFAIVNEANQSGMAIVDRMLAAMTPISLRKAGILNDRTTLADLPAEDFPLGTISPPTMIIHADDDMLMDRAHAAHAASGIPGAEPATYPEGGHMLLLQHEEVRQRIADFLRSAESVDR